MYWCMSMVSGRMVRIRNSSQRIIDNSNSNSILGDELVFVQYKTSPKFHVPQDYDFEVFFDGEGITSELTRKEIWTKTAEYKDMTITSQKNFFKVRIEKKNVRHLNGTVKIYGIKIKPEDIKEPTSTASIMGSSSLVLFTLFNIYRLFV